MKGGGNRRRAMSPNYKMSYIKYAVRLKRLRIMQMKMCSTVKNEDVISSKYITCPIHSKPEVSFTV